ncbi:Cofilin-2 [Cichlidogyrus casuarinus]|uniref:Cofilin-2 n=1 Tax=Cichlidogyrus casuarinus TaxID=1844966 RepID=A0ABD2PQY3_9PLAT
MKLDKSMRYILFALTDDNECIRIAKCAPRNATYSNFLDDLNYFSSRGRGVYAVYDYELNNRMELVFVVWCPDTIPIKSRLIIAGSKEAIKKKLVGIKKDIEANSLDEITESEMKQRVLT